MTAHSLVKALRGRWSGSYGTARCPAHDDREPSLSIATGNRGKVLVHCHAGCAQVAVVAALKVRGLWPGRDAHQRPYRPVPSPEPHRKANALEKARRDRVTRIWHQTGPASGTLIAYYLAARGIVSPLPSDLHFHPHLMTCSIIRRWSSG